MGGDEKLFFSEENCVEVCRSRLRVRSPKKTLLQNRKKERARKKNSPPPPPLSLLFPFFRGPTYLSYFHGYYLPCLSRSYNVDRQLNSFPPPSSFLSSHLASAALPQKLSRGGPKPKHLFFSSLNFLLYDPGIGRWRKIRPEFNMYLLDHPFSLRFFSCKSLPLVPRELELASYVVGNNFLRFYWNFSHSLLPNFFRRREKSWGGMIFIPWSVGKNH